MSEDTHPHMTEADEFALLSLGAPALLRILRKREQGALNRLYAEYRAATPDLRPAVAEYAAYRDLIKDFENKLRERDSKKGP
jgi:hypothetical protein